MTNVKAGQDRKSDTEVAEVARRRRFTAEYKQRVLREADACTERGAVGALLRREGLYSSHLAAWRGLAAKGQTAALGEKKRGPEKRVVDERDREIAQQKAVIAKLTRRAERAEAMVAIQKKVSELLGIALPEVDDGTSS